MNRLQLFRLLRRNVKLSEKRNPAVEQNNIAKVLLYIGGALMAFYLLGLGVVFGKMAAEVDEPGLLLLLLPIIMVIDFLMRFAVQQTPAVFVRPYLLMPLPRHTVIESYLLTLLFSGYNFLWLCLLAPYALLLLMAGTSLASVSAIVMAGLLMVLLNSQWYLLVRTLIRQSLLWWLLPIVVYGLVALPFLLMGEQLADDMLYYLYDAPILWLVVLMLAMLVVAFFLLNRVYQAKIIVCEISSDRKGPSSLKKVSKLTFLERFGLTGEFLKLELKSIMRNKAIRARVLMSLGLMVVFSALISLTDIYDQRSMLNFWCFYCFAIYGVTALVKVMGPEGNYIDLLMTQKENILLLLGAKYVFHVAVLLIPFIVMLPAVFAGKFSIMMMLAYLLITSGPVYFILFQLAIYNKQTLPLDQKITGKNQVESGIQLLLELMAMFVPLIMVAVLLLLLDELTSYVVMAAIGLIFTMTEPYWMRNIYKRMMARKYLNMEGFHASR